VSVKDTTFDAELNVTQFRIIDKFGVDSRSSAKGSIPDFFDVFPTVTGGKDIGQ
jgi:hypothetical protein